MHRQRAPAVLRPGTRELVTAHLDEAYPQSLFRLRLLFPHPGRRCPCFARQCRLRCLLLSHARRLPLIARGRQLRLAAWREETLREYSHSRRTVACLHTCQSQWRQEGKHGGRGDCRQRHQGAGESQRLHPRHPFRDAAELRQGLRGFRHLRCV